MNRRQRAVLLAVAVTLVARTTPVVAVEGTMKGLGERPIVGVDVGAMSPLTPMDQFTSTGATLAPFVGYMMNSFLGAMGQLHVIGAPNKNRPGKIDDDATWALGASLGPRMALNFGDVEFYGTFQIGGWTGLAPNSPISDTSWGFSTGGGANIMVSKAVQFGGFCRYNRLYQRAHGEGDDTYITSGVSLTYNILPEVVPPPPPPPTPAPVAAAPAPTPVEKKKIVLRGVNFDFNKWNIRPDARPVLDEAINILKHEGEISIVCAGFTDSIGSDEYNKKLSLRRAESVRDYLVKGGVAPSRITVEGFGKADPVASNATADGRAQNRRVELRVVGQ